MLYLNLKKQLVLHTYQQTSCKSCQRSLSYTKSDINTDSADLAITN